MTFLVIVLACDDLFSVIVTTHTLSAFQQFCPVPFVNSSANILHFHQGVTAWMVSPGVVPPPAWWRHWRLILCREGTADEEFCLSRVFSLTLAYNAAAMPCDCHPLGSYSNESCSAYGGQCLCKPGTTGRRCEECDVQHYALSDEGCMRE